MVCGGGMLGLPTVPDLIEAARENLATAKDKGLPCSACAPTSGEWHRSCQTWPTSVRIAQALA